MQRRFLGGAATAALALLTAWSAPAPALAGTPAAAPATPSAYSAQPQTARLLTGDVVRRDSRGVLSVVGPDAARRTTIARVDLAGRTYLVPKEVRSLVGTRLDTSLFDVGLLASKGSSTPVSIAYAASTAPTAVAGVEVTSRSGLTGTGRITAASSAALASALKTSSAGSLLANVASLRVAGSTVVTPAYPMHTVTVRVIGRDGRPADGAVVLTNVDDVRRGGTFTGTVGGSAKVSLPAGNYFVGAFVDGATGLDIPFIGETLITAPTTIRIDARTATARAAFVAPVAADLAFADVTATRTDARGNTSGIGAWLFGPGEARMTPLTPKDITKGRVSATAMAVMSAPNGEDYGVG